MLHIDAAAAASATQNFQSASIFMNMASLQPSTTMCATNSIPIRKNISKKKSILRNKIPLPLKVISEYHEYSSNCCNYCGNNVN